ncbi:MAG: hypothetical protein H6742_19190 [Alphaproteobacteria bacterium]|nr:hypothetical protein [Alphaproteobacteria bacterium]
MPVWLLVAAALARSPGEPPVGRWESVSEALAAARAAERAGDPATEWEACEAVLAFGEERHRRSCEGRIELLDDYRDQDGGFDDLSALERARRAPDEEKAAAFEALEADEGRAAPVRAAAATWLVKEAIDADDLDLALAVSDRWWAPEATTDGLAALALPERDARRHARLRVRLLFALGRSDDAHAVESLLGAATARAPAIGELAALETARTRSRLGILGRGVLAAWLLVALPLAVRGWLRRPRPALRGLVPLGVVGLGGLALAAAWAPEVAAPFLALLGVLVGTHLLSAGGAAALRDRPMWTGLFGLASGLATLAAAAVVLDRAGLWPWVGL